jgi:hypothetical protein
VISQNPNKIRHPRSLISPLEGGLRREADDLNIEEQESKQINTNNV